MSPPRRAVEAAVIPVVWGVVCGLILVVSAPLYIVATLFGLSILLGYALTGGEDAKVHMPDPQILLLTVTLPPAYPLHWLGWRLAGARWARAAAVTR